MRNLKRALSLALSTVMLMGMMVVGSGAAGYDDVSSEDNQEAIEVMQAVGIMTGDDAGNFNPDQQVTRGEMAVIMTKVLDLNTGNYSISAMPFVDVPAWAQSYVAAIYAEGVTGGTSATTYGTDEPVTAAQAALMLMRALGYFQYSSDFNDGWLLATIRQAGRIDLFNGIDAGAEEPLTRNEVAQLVLNTLEATMVEPTGSQGVQIGDVVVGSTIKYEDISKTGSEYQEIANDSADGGKFYVQLGEELFDGKLQKDSASSADDMQRPGTKWSYNGTIGTYANEADQVFVVNSTSGTKANLSTWLDDINDDYTAPTVSGSGSIVYVNGVRDTSYTVSVGDQVEIFENNTTSTTIDKLIVTQYKLAKIDKVDTNVSSTDAKNDVTAYITLKNAQGTTIGTFKNTDIEGYSAASYVEGAYIAAAINGTKALDSYVVTPAAQGQITAYKANNSYTVGGTSYKAVTTGQFVEDYTEDDFTGSYALYTDKNGLLIGIVEVEAGAVATDAVYLARLWADDSASNNYGESTLTFKAQVVDMTGAISTLTVGRTTVKGEIIGVDASGNVYTKANITADGDLETTHYYVASNGTIKNVASADTYPGDAMFGSTSTTTPFYTRVASATAGKLYTTDENTSDNYTELDEYTNATDSSYDIGTVASVSTIKTSDTRLGSYYLNSSTQYIVIEGTGSQMDVTVRTGGLSYSGAAKTATVIYTKSGSSNVAAYVILPVDEYSAGASEDVIYVDSYDGVVDGGYAYTVYNEDGSTMEIVATNAPGSVTVKGAFYKYTVDSDNV